MSYFSKTKEGVEQVLEAVLDDRIVRAIEEWHGDDLSYQDHLDMDKFEKEKKRLAAFLAKRYENTAGPDVMDSRLSRALRSYASGAGLYFEDFDLSRPEAVFVHMEQMTDLGYLVEDTAEKAEAQGWGTEEMRPEFPTITSYLEYQHNLLHQWMYHLSVCENCFGGRRSDPLFPPVDAEEVMDEAGGQSRGDRQEPPREVGYDEGYGAAMVGDYASEEEYRRLIQPELDTVDESVRIQTDEIGPASLNSADLEAVPEAVRRLLTQGYSPVYRLLEQMRADDVESYYIRLCLRPAQSVSDTGDLACFVSSGYDIGPEGLNEVAEHVGERLADHISDHVRPKLQERAGLQTVVIEVETDERITHVVIESGGSVS